MIKGKSGGKRQVSRQKPKVEPYFEAPVKVPQKTASQQNSKHNGPREHSASQHKPLSAPSHTQGKATRAKPLATQRSRQQPNSNNGVQHSLEKTYSKQVNSKDTRNTPNRKPRPNGQQRPGKQKNIQNPTPRPKKQSKRSLASMEKRSSGFLGKWLVKSFRFLAYWGLVLGLWGGITVAGILLYYAAHLPPASEWAVPERPPNVRILTADGALLANRGETGGEAVRLEQLPAYLPNAVIAIEDRRFRYHFGVDPIGLLRAAFVNFTSGRTVQGGSTITQQLAKNLFLKPDRTMQRKMQEVVLALWLEYHYSKDEILEMYLNRVYLGAGAYGVDAAARRYFGKSARMVNLTEAATLAGLLKAPSKYAPTRNPSLAEGRTQVVIAAMHKAGFITAEEATIALITPAELADKHNGGSLNYAADYVMDLLPSYIGSLKGDVIVETTIDREMQYAAQNALVSTLNAAGKTHRVSQGAVVTLNRRGDIRAMVGGYSYARSQFNRVVYAKRQPGSSFKPFVFLAALENGFQPESVLNDRRVRYKKWTPKNYDGRYHGTVTLAQSLAFSLNTISAELTNFLGPKTVIHTARRLGITSPLRNNLSLSLGTSEVTPLEIATAYVPFSNGGYGVVPHIVNRIISEDGTVLYKRQGSGKGRVIAKSNLRNLNYMLAQTMVSGTGKKARLPDRPSGGKTGTSQDFKDAWFIGYTGYLTTAVWLGNDNNKPMKKVTGGSLPAKVWHQAMVNQHNGLAANAIPGIDELTFASMPMLPKPGQKAPLPVAQSRTYPETHNNATAAIPPQPLPSQHQKSFLQRLFGG
ncbi:transglycosylase domain-containing protein [Polycladidibacter stylochi]|uniref:transglycosylase domain-containing protein n=1 Tax=Polycladidibacter stylochi TaxID=1807766 RepID=UPI000B1678FD|nr:transglycosylase domain-containing protein [Pseudovibrio stylochi]